MTHRLDVVCLCAAWCGTCREYQPAFDALAARIAGAHFVWIDVEDDADRLGDLDIDDFPTVLIARDGEPVFFGPMRPTIDVLERAVIGAPDTPPLRGLDASSRTTLIGLLPAADDR